MDDPAYLSLELALAADGIRCQFQTPGQFVISRQVGPIWPSRGNSFWVTHAGGRWHLFTWVPAGYAVPDARRIADLCRAFMACSSRVAGVVPDEIITAFGLTEISDADAEDVYRAMAGA